jgi:hypothetical protein
VRQVVEVDAGQQEGTDDLPEPSFGAIGHCLREHTETLATQRNASNGDGKEYEAARRTTGSVARLARDRSRKRTES